MAFLDFLLSVVKAFCGGSRSPPDVEKPTGAQKPPQQPQTLPGAWPRPQAQRPTVVHRPRTDHHNTDTSDNQQTHHARTRHQDQNHSNQDNEHYMSLRAKAKKEGDEMAKCFQQSHEAYASRGGALAKELSEKGKKHERTMEALNAEASAWIFRENNLDSKPGELDLHGLYVKEAISFSDKAIKDARQRGDSQVRLIVGKGLHSDGHVAKIKPALEGLMKQHSLSAEVDSHNAGVLIVQVA